MRKRRQRELGKHALARTEDVESEEVESDDARHEDIDAVVAAADEVVPVVGEQATPEPDPPSPVVSEVAEPEPPAPEAVAATPEVPAGPGNDLDALGRMLERSLTGGAEGPLPTVLPPDISATPEDILGVPTQHSAMQELQQQVTDNEGDEESQKPVTLPGAGTGAAPMEAFDEKAQMAKEVLRATSSQPSHTSVPVSGGDPPAQDKPDPADERDEDVRFSEDLTISVKRRRKLFGR
jgi:hypothetical protein